MTKHIKHLRLLYVMGDSSVTEESNYVTIKIPASLASEVDKVVGTAGYTSRAEVVKQALREFLKKYSYLSEAVA